MSHLDHPELVARLDRLDERIEELRDLLVQQRTL
jgi:hypothetical protein